MKLTTWINRVEAQTILSWQWLVSFLGILFVRFLAENFSSPAPGGLFAVDFYTLLHYALFYAGVSLSLVLFIYLLTKTSPLYVLKVLLFVLPVLWLAPAFDLILSQGQGAGMAYLFQPPIQLLKSLITYFGPLFEPGITVGIRIEVLIIILLIISYVWLKTVSILKSLIAAVGGI